MKKMLCAIVMLCVVVFGAFAQRTGVIRELTGEVELKQAGASVFVPAVVGSQVAQDTIVSTGFKGTAIIVVGNTTIAVRPLTRLSLSEIQVSSGTENLNLNLQAGRVRVDVKPPEGTKTNFTVQSPSATASVRGTVFEFDTLNLKVIEGVVNFIGTSGGGIQMPVIAGLGTTLNNDGSAVDPTEIVKTIFKPAVPVGVNATGETSAMPSTVIKSAVGSVSFDVVYQ